MISSSFIIIIISPTIPDEEKENILNPKPEAHLSAARHRLTILTSYQFLGQKRGLQSVSLLNTASVSDSLIPFGSLADPLAS